jgi:amidase
METRGLSTEYGSPVYKGRIGTADAAIVQDLRRRGAVLLGKTHTTAFAYRDPGPTRNPRNLDHTPGGSSSGSAAAVAAGMVPFALGTQTGGSVLRPASFCGVTGFKPTYGLIPTDGVLQFAKSLDTVGFFTNTPADMLALWSALDRPTGLEKGGEDETFAIAAPDPMPEVEPEMAAAFQGALSSLASRGASIRKVNIAALLVKLTEANRVLMYYEGARFHQQRYQEFGDRLGSMAALVREGLQIPQSHYNETRRFIAESQAHLVELYKATPIILVPAATGPAPLGLSSTGDSRMNAPWTALGTPAISIPMPVAGKLPLGLQLTGAPGDDARVLRTALRLDRILSSK